MGKQGECLELHVARVLPEPPSPFDAKSELEITAGECLGVSVVRRRKRADFAVVHRRWRIATGVLLGAGIALPVASVVGVTLLYYLTPLHGLLPLLGVELVGGLAAAERAACRCPQCGGPLMRSFWSIRLQCAQCDADREPPRNESESESERCSPAEAA